MQPRFGRAVFVVLILVFLTIIALSVGLAQAAVPAAGWPAPQVAPAADVAATIVVTNSNDSGAGSLRNAIAVALPGDTITFSGDMTITLGSELVISQSLTIDGETHAVTVSGGNATRVFNVTAGHVTFAHLTIADGNVQTTDCGSQVLKCGGGIMLQNSSVVVTVTHSALYSNAADYGGGILNYSGTLTVQNSTLYSNTAIHEGGGLHNYYGALTAYGSTLYSNTATYGGGLYNSTADGTCAGVMAATLVNSTFSGNAASGRGGAVYNFNGTLSIASSSIVSNTAPAGAGGGVRSWNNAATCTRVSSSLIAGNAGSDVSAIDTTQRFSSEGYNVIGTAGANVDFTLEFTQTHDLTNVVDSRVAPLADYGGPSAGSGQATWTMALLPGSPALDRGSADCPATDQREATRPLDGNRDGSAVCDIGAVEFVSSSGATYWTSGWVNAPSPGATLNFTHSLGGDPASYAVELWFRDTATPGAGINQRFYGGESVGPGPIGAYWRRLTDTSIQLYREAADDIVDQVYLRIWQPDPPDWDSGWQDIAPGQTLTLTHNLGGSTDDYVVGIKFRDTAPGGYGIHQRALGGSDWNGSYDGAAWFSLTGSSIRVVRFANDQEIDRVRLTISLPSTPPAFDSGWRSIGQGVTQVITHNLAGNVNTYSVRYSARSAIHGNNIMGAGGIEIGGNYLGTNWENLTGNSINLHRWSSDIYAPEVRVRIFLPTFHVYLPLILK